VSDATSRAEHEQTGTLKRLLLLMAKGGCCPNRCISRYQFRLWAETRVTTYANPIAPTSLGEPEDLRAVLSPMGLARSMLLVGLDCGYTNQAMTDCPCKPCAPGSPRSMIGVQGAGGGR
jgi:hypothetical protein